jgi:hypothetical protein
MAYHVAHLPRFTTGGMVPCRHREATQSFSECDCFVVEGGQDAVVVTCHTRCASLASEPLRGVGGSGNGRPGRPSRLVAMNSFFSK